MIRSSSWSPDVGMSDGMLNSPAATVLAATGASTRVNELSAKFVRMKRAKRAAVKFLKNWKRGNSRAKSILGRSPCELGTSAFAIEVGDYLLAHRLRCTGLGATHGGNDRAQDASKSSSSKPRIRWVRGPLSCFRRTETFH